MAISLGILTQHFQTNPFVRQSWPLRQEAYVASLRSLAVCNHSQVWLTFKPERCVNDWGRPHGGGIHLLSFADATHIYSSYSSDHQSKSTETTQMNTTESKIAEPLPRTHVIEVTHCCQLPPGQSKCCTQRAKPLASCLCHKRRLASGLAWWPWCAIRIINHRLVYWKVRSLAFFTEDPKSIYIIIKFDQLKSLRPQRTPTNPKHQHTVTRTKELQPECNTSRTRVRLKPHSHEIKDRTEIKPEEMEPEWNRNQTEMKERNGNTAPESNWKRIGIWRNDTQNRTGIRTRIEPDFLNKNRNRTGMDRNGKWVKWKWNRNRDRTRMESEWNRNHTGIQPESSRKKLKANTKRTWMKPETSMEMKYYWPEWNRETQRNQNETNA